MREEASVAIAVTKAPLPTLSLVVSRVTAELSVSCVDDSEKTLLSIVTAELVATTELDSTVSVVEVIDM